MAGSNNQAQNSAMLQQALSTGMQIQQQNAQIKAQEGLNKSNQNFSQWQYQQSLQDNRYNSDIAFARSRDFKGLMQAYREAGINPYMVAGSDSYSTPAQGGTQNTPKTDVSNYAAIGETLGQLPTRIAQLQLINSQRSNIDSQTQGQNIENENAPLKNYLGNQQAEAIIANTKQTTQNLEATHANIEALTANEKTKGIALEYQNIIAQIESAQYEEMRTLQREQISTQNSKSRQEIKESKARIENLKIMSQKLQLEINLNAQALMTGVITQEEARQRVFKLMAEFELTTEKIETERTMRGPQKDATERSNFGTLTPVNSFLQGSEKYKEKLNKKLNNGKDGGYKIY